MKWFIKVIKNYAVFSGRARRKEYWMFLLFNNIFYWFVASLSAFGSIFSSLALIYALGMIIPNFAVLVRRMHDVGKSGWYCLIPIYGFILLFRNGEKGSNKYGQDPKELFE